LEVDTKKPLFFERSLLPHKAVMIECLNNQKEPIEKAYASGFILKESDGLYLYTAWHVITGYDLHNLPPNYQQPNRMEIRLSKIKSEQQNTNSPLQAYVLNGLETVDIPLYENQDISRPLWHQDPIQEFNGASIQVPDKHDAVKIKLPDTFEASDIQIVKSNELNNQLIFPGDRIYIVGYPYKFSTRGEDNPSPVVLTKFVASTSIKNRLHEFLIDGLGAPGMSGGPVFIERNEQIFLLGIYTGAIYTDIDNKDKQVGALSTCVNMTLCWTIPIAALKPLSC
jgi:hypothetical protein